MFLLKPDQIQGILEQFDIFTFHNVSIKTGKTGRVSYEITEFTFHNVSIKTFRRPGIYLPQVLIYIPQCFY